MGLEPFDPDTVLFICLMDPGSIRLWVTVYANMNNPKPLIREPVNGLS